LEGDIMGDMRRLPLDWMFARGLLVLVACFSISSITAQAQQPGNKAVYNSTCLPPASPCGASTAYVDASVFLPGSDICQKIFKALQSLPAGPKVVDARGITTPASCGAGETPWLNTGTNLVVPSTILLPAGTITISSPWKLPDGSRIIGVGTGTADTAGTVLQVSQSFSGTMIQMGDNSTYCPSAGICHGISVEDLILDGEGQLNVSGILNANSQELSYVNHVKLFQIMGMGLNVMTNAQNSGPYSNITFETGNFTPSASTSCVQILLNGVGTRGIHGLTCISNSLAPDAAIYLDASNNSIEDVLIEGFTDGVRVGSQSAAHSNVLFNIVGDTSLVTATQGPNPITVIHVTNNSGSPVSDISMVGIRNTGSGSFTIRDDVTAKTLGDPSISIYALGEAGPGGTAHSLFTTSPNAASWAFSNGSPNAGACTSTNYGSLYSSTSGGSTGVLWVCEIGGWRQII
jgi:hypothetical protein